MMVLKAGIIDITKVIIHWDTFLKDVRIRLMCWVDKSSSKDRAVLGPLQSLQKISSE